MECRHLRGDRGHETSRHGELLTVENACKVMQRIAIKAKNDMNGKCLFAYERGRSTPDRPARI